FIGRHQPDIICLQEFCSSPTNKVWQYNDLEIIQDKFPDLQMVYSPHLQFNFLNEWAFSGIGVLSAAPIKQKNIFFTRGQLAEDYSAGDDYNMKSLLHVVISSAGSDLNILTHQGQHIRGTKMGNDETLKQMAMIADYIDTLSGPVVLTGDFNLVPESPSLSRLN